MGLFSTWAKPWPNCRAPLSFSTRAAATPSEGVEEQAEGFTDTQPRGRTAGLFSRGCFDYLERVAAPSVVVQKYKRLRAVEVALCGTLHDMVTDAALNFAARSCAVCWRTT